MLCLPHPQVTLPSPSSVAHPACIAAISTPILATAIDKDQGSECKLFEVLLFADFLDFSFTFGSQFNNALRLTLSFRDGQEGSLVVNATSLEPRNGVIMTHTYVISSLSQDICIGGLELGTHYNVCVFIQLNEEVVGLCKQIF